jgi:regulator of cell morphogenesis and NO signaling
MSTETLNTVEHLAGSNPLIARHLCRLGIDALEQGGLSLEEACRALGLDPERTRADLKALPAVPQRDWMAAPIAELVHHIILHHHVWTREELGRIQALLDAELASEGPGREALARIRTHVANLARDLTAHFQMEERNLFPAICAAEGGGAPPISLSTPSEQARTIAAEHQAVEELFHNVRIMTADYEIPKGATPGFRAICLALRTLEDDLHLHLFLENHILFPRALPS